jgi:hypothetical protein
MKVEVTHPEDYDAGAYAAAITLEPGEPHQGLEFALPALTGITIVSAEGYQAAVPVPAGGAVAGGKFDEQGRWKGNAYNVGPGDPKKIEAALRKEAEKVVNAKKKWDDGVEARLKKGR